jgi:hypothetical protein
VASREATAWRALRNNVWRTLFPAAPLGPSGPGTYGKEVTGTTLENVTISPF